MITPARFGVEEEFILIDGETTLPLAEIERVLPVAQREAGDLAQHELHRAQIEIATEPSSTLGEIREQLTRLRSEMAEAARSRGGLLIASGTYPGRVGEKGRQITVDERYEELAHRFGEIARDQIVCGCHVHVEIEDPDLAIRTMNRSRRWLSVILALAGNSPFSEARDTGYSSFRTAIWSRWPTGGPAGYFCSRTEYDDILAKLVASGVILDEGMAYWDVRPSQTFPTLEFRMSDVALTVDHACLVAALVRALATTCADEVEMSPEPALRHELLRSAQWRAARSGFRKELIDPLDGTRMPAAEMIGRFLDFVGNALVAHDDEREVSKLLDRIRDQGSGAELQRRAFERAGSIEQMLDELSSLTTSE